MDSKNHEDVVVVEDMTGIIPGQMQQTPLLISSLIQHAALNHPEREIVSRRIEGGKFHSTNYYEVHSRAKRLANVLRNTLKVKPGQRVGTIAFNTYRHIECYYGISGAGRVLHTINPRLAPEQLIYVVNHADDKYLLVDIPFVRLVEAVADACPNLQGCIVLTDEAHMPTSDKIKLFCYETLLAAESDAYIWPTFDENTASSLCYTSGTTGDPKGVLYSHRSTILHSYALTAKDCIGISSNDVVNVIVPLFHANSWGISYAAFSVGCKLVLPGAKMDGESMYELLETEECNVTCGVPTIFIYLLQYLDANPDKKLTKLKRAICGGSAVAKELIIRMKEVCGCTLMQGWGMTEMSPLGSINSILLPKHSNISEEDELNLRIKQGRHIYGCEMRIVDDNMKELPRDGKACGALQVCGPWIIEKYFRRNDETILHDGRWFDTGDIATIDEDGYMLITDRAKDLIKSGGEWISSVDVENKALSCGGVLEAACIGVSHPKWQERPLLIVKKKDDNDESVTKESILEKLKSLIPKWWLPDDVIFVKELPHTATGKVLKRKLRDIYADYKLPT